MFTSNNSDTLSRNCLKYGLKRTLTYSINQNIIPIQFLKFYPSQRERRFASHAYFVHFSFKLNIKSELGVVQGRETAVDQSFILDKGGREGGRGRVEGGRERGGEGEREREGGRERE